MYTNTDFDVIPWRAVEDTHLHSPAMHPSVITLHGNEIMIMSIAYYMPKPVPANLQCIPMVST